MAKDGIRWRLSGTEWDAMETNEISLHQVKIFEFVRKADRWVTMKDVVAATGSRRETVGNHLRRFVSLGLMDQAEVWPGHRFRVSVLAEKRNKAMLERLDRAKEIFGV
jgi:hypothetical protein